MTTADELRARIEADLLTAHAIRQAERPTGLTASSVGGCPQYAARELLGVPQDSEGEFFRGLRGTWVHDGLADDLALVDPEFTDGRTGRFTWRPGGGLPDITGAGDFALGDVSYEVKTRPKTECRWHADHGPDPQHAMQAAIDAEANGRTEAAVAYLPTDAGWEEAVVCVIDVAHWTAEARFWLEQVDVRAEYQAMIDRGTRREVALARVLDPVPRDTPLSWCTLFCGHFKDCRGDYIAPADLEIQDPVIRQAAQEAEHWRRVRLDAKAKETAAKSRLTHAEGRVSAPADGGAPIDVRHQDVDDKPGRRGHTKTVITRRPG